MAHIRHLKYFLPLLFFTHSSSYADTCNTESVIKFLDLNCNAISTLSKEQLITPSDVLANSLTSDICGISNVVIYDTEPPHTIYKYPLKNRLVNGTLNNFTDSEGNHVFQDIATQLKTSPRYELKYTYFLNSIELTRQIFGLACTTKADNKKYILISGLDQKDNAYYNSFTLAPEKSIILKDDFSKIATITNIAEKSAAITKIISNFSFDHASKKLNLPIALIKGAALHHSTINRINENMENIKDSPGSVQYNLTALGIILDAIDIAIDISNPIRTHLMADKINKNTNKIEIEQINTQIETLKQKTLDLETSVTDLKTRMTQIEPDLLFNYKKETLALMASFISLVLVSISLILFFIKNK